MSDRLRGELRLPGDKSMSHRALLYAALAEDYLAVPRSKDVLGGKEPLFNRAREAALQHHWHARAPHGVE